MYWWFPKFIPPDLSLALPQIQWPLQHLHLDASHSLWAKYADSQTLTDSSADFPILVNCNFFYLISPKVLVLPLTFPFLLFSTSNLLTNAATHTFITKSELTTFYLDYLGPNYHHFPSGLLQSPSTHCFCSCPHQPPFFSSWQTK